MAEEVRMTDTSLTCIHCGGRMNEGGVPFHIGRKDYHLSLDAVPAWVCRQGGKSCFQQREVRIIQGLLAHLDKQTAIFDSVA